MVVRVLFSGNPIFRRTVIPASPPIGNFVVSNAGEAYDAQAEGPNQKLLSEMLFYEYPTLGTYTGGDQ
jgi:hypothetical protein